MKPKYTLCIDPGSNIGWAVYNGTKLTDYGLIDGGKHEALYNRINYIEDQISALISKWTPVRLIIEGITAISQPSKAANFWLNYTFGFCTSTASRAKIPIEEINPASLKKHLRASGVVSRESHPEAYGKNGQINKVGVVHIVNTHLGLGLKKKDHNIADAIALGLVGLGVL